MNLSKGCPYCDNLKCTKEPLLEFECGKNKNIKIENAGACFTAVVKIGGEEHRMVVENCPDFTAKNNVC